MQQFVPGSGALDPGRHILLKEGPFAVDSIHSPDAW